VTIVPFPAPPAGGGGEIVTAAVDRYLDSIKTRTTRRRRPRSTTQDSLTNPSNTTSPQVSGWFVGFSAIATGTRFCDPRMGLGLSAAVKRWHPVAAVSGTRCRGRG
jgi:hypothetical protein